MNKMNIGLIGLGVIGAPIAHRIYSAQESNFYIIANGERKERFNRSQYFINGDYFNPLIASNSDDVNGVLNLLIVCVKNYSLKYSLIDIRNVITDDTIILPLQNGIFSYDFFKKEFPRNRVLKGFVQGPNTEINNDVYTYQNSGVMHIGSDDYPEVAKEVYEYLKKCNVSIQFENDIKHMVWKKLMLNVAGNSITALTGADYSLIKQYSDLQQLCYKAMREFSSVAWEEGVYLSKEDIDDVIDYFITYTGNKKTSMLVDVINERKTENDYLAGTILSIAQKYRIEVPTIKTLYYLMEIKEEVYMEKKGLVTMKNLFAEDVIYSDSLRANMKDIDKKMESVEYARSVNTGSVEKLNALLTYAAENTAFYGRILGGKKDFCITDFPVMNKTLLNANYDDIMVHSYDNIKTHKMHTSGSTGIPFTVVQDLAKRERHIADLKYFGAMAGYTDHDPMCYLRAKPTATKADQDRDKIWQLDICNLNAKNLTDYYHVMCEKECVALIAYPSTLETAVDFWSTHFFNESKIKTIISTSETLTDEVKEKLRRFFGDEVGIFARYSNTENGILGQEYGTSGTYRLNWASYYFEVLKLESDEPAEVGELGRIVVTDLYNKAFPMIRYDTGDVAILRKVDNDTLPEFAELLGRRMDLVYDTNGEVVSPFLLCRTMRLSSEIEQWQFIQENEKTYTLKITSTNDVRPNVDKEVEGFKKTLGQDAVIHIEYVEDIPVMNSLKRKLIVSKLNK